LFFLSLDLLGWSIAYPVDSPSSFSALCELVGCSCSICRRGHKWFGSLSRFWW
ncbi:unnamed protein product, partial [Brassica oleracea var. botrytis]